MKAMLAALLVALGISSATGAVVTYSAPAGEAASPDYQVEVSGRPVAVYTARTLDAPFAGKEWDFGGPYSFANFDTDGPIDVRITSPRSLRQTAIRPAWPDVKTRFESDHTLVVSLPGPRKLSIEPDGKKGPLLLFANPLEENAPKPDAPGVIYFGPGIHRPGRIEVTNNQVLYLAGGAVVKGGVLATGEDIRITGRGILDGSDYEWRKGPTPHVISIRGTNVEVSGITIRGASHWTIVPRDSRNVTVRGVKLCGSRVQNDDGINPCNSQDVLITDCFIRTDDDCVALKGLEYTAANSNVERITVENCVLWCDRARIFLLGHESRAPFMRGITLRNLDIIHFTMTPFLFEPGEEMRLEDVTVENVRLHGEGQAELVRLKPVVNQYMRKQVPGHVQDIRFRNVSVTGTPGDYRVQLIGADPDHAVRNIAFENVEILGQRLAAGSERLQVGEHVDGVQFAAGTSPSPREVTAPKPSVLEPTRLKSYVEAFNRNDQELYPQHVPNSAAEAWLRQNIPLFECPDPALEETYYFRWWTYRKHLKQTPAGFIITEFLPAVDWAGKYNSISCAAGHHLREGRWLNDPQYLDDYARFWFRHGGEPRRYSFWAADSIWARALVTGDARLAQELLPELIANYEAWEREQRDANGLYWQADGRDGMEVSISGTLQSQAEGYRATINSYQYGDALAIAQIAGRAGRGELAASFRSKAAELKRLVETKLWDDEARFFKVLPRGEGTRLSDARELHGFTPWYFNLPDPDKSVAWQQLMDPQGFAAPFGPTTAERRHARFAVSYEGHECQWNGPSWPYATAITLTALANLLNDYPPQAVRREDYFALLKTYAKSHRLTLDDGRVVPWIDENLNPLTGDWLSRTRLKSWRNGTWDAGKGGVERGKDYNHSTFCDLVISGLVGLRPRADETVEVSPLLPEGAWDYFCLDQVRYHDRWLTILYDRTGERYRRGKGLRVLADGKEIGAAGRLERIRVPLPDKAAAASRSSTNSVAMTADGWMKYAGNPVLGGQYGTCFDVAVLKEAETYRMWVSWRPKRSLGLVESPDAIHWSGPPRIVLGPRPESGWEDDINRPVVLQRADGYHLWYTGQARAHSWIGYATSPDGVNWKRQSDRPVLSPEQPWEKVAVMCPHVLWDEQTGRFRMWYSGGDQYEPDAIGYATSPDGLNWTRHASNPVFQADPNREWEQHKVTACQVIQQGDWHVMFYIGFRDVDHAQIGMARSRDGITGWQRHPANPIIRPGQGEWDHDACYKPFAIRDGGRWRLWYNGRQGNLEQIGVVFREADDLGFE